MINSSNQSRCDQTFGEIGTFKQRNSAHKKFQTILLMSTKWLRFHKDKNNAARPFSQHYFYLRVIIQTTS